MCMVQRYSIWKSLFKWIKKYTIFCVTKPFYFLINLIARNIYKDNTIFRYWLKLIFPFIKHTFKDANGIRRSSNHLGFCVEFEKKRKEKSTTKTNSMQRFPCNQAIVARYHPSHQIAAIEFWSFLHYSRVVEEGVSRGQLKDNLCLYLSCKQVHSKCTSQKHTFFLFLLFWVFGQLMGNIGGR